MKYEYKIVKTRNLSEEELNKLGRLEWQMVHITNPSWTHEYEIIFMRESYHTSYTLNIDGGASFRKPHGAWFLSGEDSLE